VRGGTDTGGTGGTGADRESGDAAVTWLVEAAMGVAMVELPVTAGSITAGARRASERIIGGTGGGGN
jgi:hypothetical protein